MPKPTGPKDGRTQQLVFDLKTSKKKFYKDLAKRLSKPARIKQGVNLDKIEELHKSKEAIIVPGKVLGNSISKKVNVYALSYSKTAKKALEESGGTAGLLEDLIKDKKVGRIIV